MKYYDRVAENFLLIRLVATRFCNYECPYCYVPLEKKSEQKSMFSHHSLDEWIQALKNNFLDKSLEFYFTGGEPLIIKDSILLIKTLVEWDNVTRIRIDTNLSAVDNFLSYVNSEKVTLLTAFHPTQISFNKYIEKAKKVQKKGMLDVVNFVASKENLKLVNMSPHNLIKIFNDMGTFLNVAKDFHRGLSEGWEYDQYYKKYIDILQYPLDNSYMNLGSLNKGFLCGSGKHYISINRHGQTFSCGGEKERTVGYGNIFDGTLNLPNFLQVCNENICPSIISYSFSSSNDFLPLDHTKGYAERCNEIRKGISEAYLENLWKQVNINQIIVKKNRKKIIKKIIKKLKMI